MSGSTSEQADVPVGDAESPVRMVANVSGPLESFPQEFYVDPESLSPYSDSNNASADITPVNGHLSPQNAYPPAHLQQHQHQRQAVPTLAPPPLTTAKSHPAISSQSSLSSSANVNGLATRLEEVGNLAVAPFLSFEPARSRRSSRRSFGQRSPGKGDSGKLHKRRPSANRSPPLSSSHPRLLFGEVPSDGSGSYHVAGLDEPSSHGPLPSFRTGFRRQSDTTSVLHGRSQSHQNLSPPSHSDAASLIHRRSRSEMEPAMVPGLQSLISRSNPHLLPPQAYQDTREGARSTPPGSRIPISRSSRAYSGDAVGTEASTKRSVSAIPDPSSRARLSKSPTPYAASEKGLSPSSIPRSTRYRPPPIHSQSASAALAARITAPPPQKSPPLRSSRPRQPVNAALTSASRARAAERFQGALTRDGRRPSEEWMGKPYDSQKERTRRRIPELDKVDLAARRAKIQEAMAQHLAHSPSGDIRSRSRSRTPSYATTMSNNSGSRSTSAQLPTTPLDASAPKSDDTTGSAVDPANTNVPTLEEEPLSARTDFEDDSPVLGAAVDVASPELLSAATFQPKMLNVKKKEPTIVGPPEPAKEDNGAAGEAESTLNRDHGSIRIMLDGDPSLGLNAHNSIPETSDNADGYFDVHTSSQNENAEAPTGDQTPQQTTPQDDILKSSAFQPSVAFAATTEGLANDAEINRMLDKYQDTGNISPEIFEHLQSRMVDFNRLSANGGSDGFMVQSLLDSILNRQSPGNIRPEITQTSSYEFPPVTPDTPPDAGTATGTAVVFDGPALDINADTPKAEVAGAVEEEDFETIIRKADEEWERQQRGETASLGTEDIGKPPPPPKPVGYTPRSSVVTSSGLPTPSFGEMTESGQSSSGAEAADENIETSEDESGTMKPGDAAALTATLDAAKLSHGLPDTSDRGSSELSPRFLKQWGQSGSSRPSVDSHRASFLANPALSTTSVTDASTRHNSMETSSENQAKFPTGHSPGPEQKRLLRRRHIIRELLDTENTYHQDLKIIEDIYRATAADIVSSEDKKILFGNCDEVERFSLHFYDELRRAVAPVYQPPKQMRWGNNRGSYSTTQSDGVSQSANGDAGDEEKDRATTVGRTFLTNFLRMDQVYGAYLKNHDAANQRLATLKTHAAVKCWLDECHNNASDITSAWDLDSLLVKPTQRVSKYPMLLQQLLETTPVGHPDHEALKAAAKDSITMLTRINDAKKRADLVDQIINRKAKDDVRSGFAKAFGRRTEKLKERVGIAEAWQDPEFDEIAHKFGGHFIRLQICMRDVQDYINRIDRSMEQINNCASALELYTDVSPSTLPEIESKWRRYGQVIREISAHAFPEHKSAVQRRVIKPMVTCIELHKGPQNAINQRKKRIVDYAKCKSIEKRGEKPDKKTIEASEMYLALNDHLKLELPRLYNLTATLVQNCLRCFLDIQLEWHNVWERKLRSTIDAIDIPPSIQVIEPAFRSDYNQIKDELLKLGVCNGSILADTTTFLSPSSTLVADSDSSTKRTGDVRSGHSGRTFSIASDSSPSFQSVPAKRYSSGYGSSVELPIMSNVNSRNRSNSSVSNNAQQLTPGHASAAALYNNHSWQQYATTPTSSRPPTSNQGTPYQIPRSSSDFPRSSRPTSGNTFGTARAEHQQHEDHRFSGLFNSAMPPDSPSNRSSAHSANLKEAAEDTPVMFVCASLFEFSIDKTRKEAGYPYLTYVQGEVFDVIAQKGELWLAKNQDDDTNTLGWIWEQHFVILSGE